MAVSNARSEEELILTLPSEREVMMTRLFNAPRRMVFEACTQPQHLIHWFGPRGWTLPVCEVDFRAGGAWRFVLHGPGGKRMGMHGEYREIVPHGRLVWTEVFDDFPANETLVTLRLDEQDGKTRMHTTVLYPSAEVRDAILASGMEKGAGETYDRLAERLPVMVAALEKMTEREIVLTRLFNAPRELVFRAWTERDRLQRWWGPKGFTNPVCEIDVRPGGAILIHMRAPDGTVYPMSGVFHEIEEPERIVFTSAALDDKGDPIFEIHNTVTFAERGGQTELTVRAKVAKVHAAIAAQYLAGMEIGWSMSLDRLGDEVKG